MSSPIIFAYGLDSQTPLNGPAIAEGLKADQPAWVHLDANSDEALGWLEASIGYLDHLVVRGLMAMETRPRMTQIGEGALIVLRGINLAEGAEPEDMVSIRLYIDPHRIISVRLRPVKSAEDIARKIDRQTGPRDAGALLSELIGRLSERMQPVLTELDEQIDEIETMLIESENPDLRADLVGLRKQAILFRRHMAPMRDVVAGLQISDFEWLSPKHRRELTESQNHLTRYVEDLDAIRERAQIIKDELAATRADRMNRQMFILSVISAIFLPLGFVTGLLGINVGGMPGADNQAAFWITCLALFVAALGIIAVLKRNRWF